MSRLDIVPLGLWSPSTARIANDGPMQIPSDPLDDLCAELGPDKVVIVTPDAVYSCDRARFNEGRGS